MVQCLSSSMYCSIIVTDMSMWKDTECPLQCMSIVDTLPTLNAFTHLTIVQKSKAWSPHASHTWSGNKVRELITVKMLHTSLLNTTVVAFKVLPLGRYVPMSAPSPPFKTILELVLWNGLQSYCCFTPDVINVIKMPSFLYFLYLREQKKVTGG